MNDSISRQAALDCVTYDVEYTTECIKALPSLQPTCNQLATDCISRQAAIDEWKNDFKGYVNALNIPRDDYNGIMEYIDELPSAQSEQTKMIKEIREWINSGNRGSADYFIVDKIEEIINKYE